jgi:hypothetical protein
MSVGVLRHDGAIRLHLHMPAAPAPFLNAVAPSRDGLVVAVACLFTWYGRADLWAPEGMPVVLGHARSRQAMHGGTANNDTSDAHTIAALLRGGRLPQASVSPAQRRATRDRLRRRPHLRRQRSALLAHVHHTHRQDTVPEIGKTMASKANRAGGAERLRAPAVPKTSEVDLARLTSDDARLKNLALSILTTAKHHDAPTLSRWPTGPGIGTMRRRVLLDDIHQLERFPSVPAVVSSARLVHCAKESAGTRVGTAGKKLGNAHLTWAFAAAAPWFRRTNPQGQPRLARLEQKHPNGNALTLLAHQRARAVYALRKRTTAFAMALCLRPSGSSAGEPRASLANPGDAPRARTREVVRPLRL